jgi:rhodanese-related sulfurtransferase
MNILKNFLVYIFLLEIAFGITNAVAEPIVTQGNIYKQLTAIKCDSLIKANDLNPNFVILDVRTASEWSSYHLLGSINRSTGLTDFDAQLAALPKHKLYLLHCQSGGRSAGAFSKMKNLGFAEVYEMIGGLNAWNSAKLPTTTVKGPKLMFVSKSDIIQGVNTDTIKITITNRANDLLKFNSVYIKDNHAVSHNFDNLVTIDGAMDYNFSVYHTPKYSGVDSTKIYLESNGGNIEVDIQFKNGIITSIYETQPLQLTLFPNPVSSKFFINGNTEIELKEVAIFNLAGKTVFSEKDVNVNEGINITSLQNGVYVVKINTGFQTISKKLVVKK